MNFNFINDIILRHNKQKQTLTSHKKRTFKTCENNTRKGYTKYQNNDNTYFIKNNNVKDKPTTTTNPLGN